MRLLKKDEMRRRKKQITRRQTCYHGDTSCALGRTWACGLMAGASALPSLEPLAEKPMSGPRWQRPLPALPRG